MNPIRVTVIVERIEWTDGSGQPLTMSSVTATAWRERDMGTPMDGEARIRLASVIDEAASKATTMAFNAKVWEER